MGQPPYTPMPTYLTFTNVNITSAIPRDTLIRPTLKSLD